MKQLGDYSSGLWALIFGRKKGNKAAGSGLTKTAANMANSSLLDITAKVIKYMEGGYFHPDMLKDGRINDSRYSTSGETMFGIDRKAGGAINNTPAGVKFWGLIDNANARKLWKWNYMGGPLASELLPLAAEIIAPEAVKNFKRYLSPEARDLVESDRRLLFHFIYATWNGPGWFKHFAGVINGAIAAGEKNPDALFNLAIKSRTTIMPSWAGSKARSLIAQGGNKIANLANKI